MNGWDIDWRPSGLRWQPTGRFSWTLHTIYPVGLLQYMKGFWYADSLLGEDVETIECGSLHACARALVKAVAGRTTG